MEFRILNKNGNPNWSNCPRTSPRSLKFMTIFGECDGEVCRDIRFRSYFCSLENAVESSELEFHVVQFGNYKSRIKITESPFANHVSVIGIR